jgi:hypothetical protein
MNLNTLAKDIELHIVNHEHGWGVQIKYTYRRTNQVVSEVSAMYQEGHLMKTHDKNNTDRDEAIFFSVDLPNRPERGDKIEVDGITWLVERLLGSDPYDIVCVANERHATGRKTRNES